MPSLKAMTQEVKKAPKFAGRGNVNRQSIFQSREKVTASDSESESESETDSESEADPTKAAVPSPKVNGQKFKREAARSPPDITRGRENESTSKADDRIIGSDNESESYSDSESESGSGSDSDTSSEGAVSADRGTTTTSNNSEEVTRQGSTVHPSIPSRATAPYTPPAGFEESSTKSGSRPKASQVFSPKNLAGKQIWYITAPASVPISAVKKVSLHDVQLGKPALSADGHNYGFVRDQVENKIHTKLMVPDENSKLYRIGKRAIDHTLHLQEIIKLPNLEGTITHNSSRSTASAKKHVPQQPKGLKMRFRPIGFGRGKTGTIGSSSPSHASSTTESGEDDELKDTTSKFDTPVTLGAKHHALTGSLPKLSAKDESFHSSKVMKNAPEPSGSSEPDITQDSDASSESSDEEGTLPVAKDVLNPYQPSLKRKLSDTSGSSQDTNNHLHSSEANGGQLKKLKLLETSSPVVLPKQVRSKSNYTLKSAMPPPISSFPGSTTNSSPNYLRRSTSILPPPRFASKKNSSPAPSPAPGKEWQAPVTTPILPRRNKILPAGSKVTPIKNALEATEPKSRSKAERAMSLEDRIKAIDPRLSEEQRKEEIKRLRRNEQSRISHAKRKKGLLNSSAQTVLAQETAPNATSDINPLSSTPEPKLKKPDLGVALEKGGGKAMKDQKTPLFSPPRKASVILPPKARVSIPK